MSQTGATLYLFKNCRQTLQKFRGGISQHQNSQTV